MITLEIYRDSLIEASKVDFLTEVWEIKLYTSALCMAKEWGDKKTKEHEDYFKQNHLIDKYNV